MTRVAGPVKEEEEEEEVEERRCLQQEMGHLASCKIDEAISCMAYQVASLHSLMPDDLACLLFQKSKPSPSTPNLIFPNFISFFFGF